MFFYIVHCLVPSPDRTERPDNTDSCRNGKSILKAGELKKGERFYVVADGSDAKEAIEALDRLFPCAVNQPDVQSCPSKKVQKRR